RSSGSSASVLYVAKTISWSLGLLELRVRMYCCRKALIDSGGTIVESKNLESSPKIRGSSADDPAIEDDERSVLELFLCCCSCPASPSTVSLYSPSTLSALMDWWIDEVENCEDEDA